MKDRIKKIRQALGLSQGQFAYGIKVSDAEVADYGFRGNTGITLLDSMYSKS